VLSSLTSHAGSTMSCEGSINCPGTSDIATYTSSSPCTWTRKLCVSCDDSSGTTMIKVQSNGLPNHCFSAVLNTIPAAFEYEWQAAFNADVSSIMNYTSANFDTSAETDEILCDLQRTGSSNMNSASAYSLLTTTRRLADEVDKTEKRELQPSGGPGGSSSSSSSSSSSGGVEALSTASGIGLSGAYIYNALAGGNVDAVENEGDTLDVCLSHPTPT